MTLYNVGKIVNTHGVRGELRVIAVTDAPEERFTNGARLYVEGSGGAQEVTVKSHRKHKQFDLVTFEEINSMDEASALKGQMLMVAEEDRVPTEEDDEFYYDEIIGALVYTEDGTELGTVKEILPLGANDVWVVKRGHEKKDVLLPFIEDVVLDVNVAEQTITVRLLEGLLPE
ncbi:ribosome maturation factor RimM [Salsuginibacillus kocurii]|uniref:ribosome maturation factor RimM n=1 Tax=Salsuginibacillus kocurii TaxID=427078 RepID=UPI000377A490|nr:ribosome maturation factor RimM [Salsuginibacillus kocurii]